MTGSSPICIDANLVVRLAADARDEAMWALWDGWSTAGRSVVAPSLLRYEITNVLHRSVTAGLFDATAAHAVLNTALNLGIAFEEGPGLHAPALVFAARFALPAAYDAHYLALADRLGAEFWTADRRLANSVRPVLPWVRLVEP